MTFLLKSFQIKLALVLIICLVSVGTIYYSTTENWSLITSFYFTISTLTTVGYGDLYPTSEAGRLFTAIFMIVGVITMLVTISGIAQIYLESNVNRPSTGKKRKKTKISWKKNKRQTTSKIKA